MALYRLTHGALTVQPVLYLTVGMVWHCTVLLLMLCTASIVSYRRHELALYRLTHGARYSHLLPSAWPRYAALYRLTPVPCNAQPAVYLIPWAWYGIVPSYPLGYDARTP